MSAFGQDEGPQIVEIVNGLLDDETAKPLLSLVAETSGHVVGHILFTAAKLQSGNHDETSIRILAPLAVSGSVQGKGVGGALITEGLAQLAETGVELVFVLGHPAYYPKFGYRPAGVLGYDAPYPIPSKDAEAWMVRELKAGVIGTSKGTIRCADVLDQPQHWRE